VLDSINSRPLHRILKDLYHRRGPERRHYNPLSILKAQLLKHLLHIPSDRRLALRLKRDRKAARACGFRKETPCHSLLTHFRHRLGEDTYLKIFDHLLRRLLKKSAVKARTSSIVRVQFSFPPTHQGEALSPLEKKSRDDLSTSRTAAN
jgi:transposase